VDPGRHEIVITFPAGDVPSRHAGRPGVLRTAVYRVDVPVTGSMYQFWVQVTDSAGKVLPSDRLHHVLIFDPDHRELFVPIALRLLAAGKETGAPSVPRILLGVPLRRGQRLIASGMLSNPDEAPLRRTGLRVVLRYQAEPSLWPLFHAYPFSIDVAFPLGGEGGTKMFDLTVGRSERSWEGRPATAGTIVGAGVHLHDYAVRIELRDLRTGKVLWEAKPVTDSAGRLQATPIAHFFRWYRLGIRVSPQRRYRVTVVYHNPTGATLPGAATGAVVGLVVADDPRAWPTVNPADPIYRTDLDNLLRNMSGVRVTHAHQ
jgi:hypothetical protein